MALNIKSLERQRATIKGKLTRLTNNLADLSEETSESLSKRLSDLTTISNQFEETQNRIEEIDLETDYDQLRSDFEYLHHQCWVKVSSRLNELKTVRPNHAPSRNENFGLSQSLIPRIQITPFSGDFTTWNSFYDSFKGLVHEEESMSAVHKFHILKSCLQGDAAAVIASLNATEENYGVAWALIQKRFNQPEKIIQSHIRGLFELPNGTKNSLQSLRQIAERAEAHINALKALKEPVEWHSMLIYIVSARLDRDTRLCWERSQDEQVKPTIYDLIEFLFKFSKDTEPISLHDRPNHSTRMRKTSRVSPPPKGHDMRCTRAHVSTMPGKEGCPLCKGCHRIQTCSEFLKLDPRSKAEQARIHRLCTNCLRTGHNPSRCEAGTCRRCQGRHHTLLHISKPTEVTTSLVAEPSDPPQPSSSFTVLTCSEFVLATARVYLNDKSGNKHETRVLLDSGSQSNFITERLAEKLGLPQRTVNIPTSGIGQATGIAKTSVTTIISSKLTAFSSKVTFLTLPYITGNLPSKTMSPTAIQIPQNITLADPEFYNSNPVDALLGEALFFKLLSVGQISLPGQKAVLQKTGLGWIISGEIRVSTKPSTQAYVALKSDPDPLDKQLEVFWELEEMPRVKLLSREDQICERKFEDHTTRDASGRYMVRLPFNEKTSELGNSYDTALRRFLSLERRLHADLNLRTQYTAFMQEYLRLGHMREVVEPASFPTGYYLPHHAVTKQVSLTTKVRVVFDGSAKSTTGYSLNDTLMVGPKIQDDLFNLIVRFRSHAYVLTADIEKMFRQIRIHPDDTHYQKILWREHSSQPIKTYALQTVTYGTACAPYLAVRVLKQLSRDRASTYPKASAALAKNELSGLRTLITSDSHNETMTTELANWNIRWHLSPPRAPHFGGLWEAAVRAFKHHFIRTVGETLFTYEQLNSYIVQIEAILNSRPLCPLSADPEDLSVLTPAHLLIGSSLLELPETNLEPLPSNRLSAWQHVQKLKQGFWKRWHKDYLNQLHIRSKWKTGSTDAIRNGTLVMIKEDNLPPSKWALGRVIATHPGPDNIIRVVELRTAKGTLTRSLKSLCPLPTEGEDYHPGQHPTTHVDDT